MLEPSPSVKSGNVLALLNTLYASGFAMASPSTPMLKGRTMHTLYAISFIVYSSNCLCDWIHVWATLKGRVTSFPLENWLVVSLVGTVVAGTMTTWLLLVLCMENAFAHRLDVTPYRSGLALIWEAIVDWIQAFNNFRVAFLVMALHDTPMTIMNFYFISSCRCAGPNVTPWSLLISVCSSLVSVIWRIAMLYFSYRRMICPMKKASNAITVGRLLTPSQHWKAAINTSDKGRLSEFDECFPIRVARYLVYGQDVAEDDEEVVKNIEDMGNLDANANYCWKTKEAPKMCRLPLIRETVEALMTALRWLHSSLLFTVCSILSLFGYIGMLLLCCIPYCYHYSCRHNSFYHRHKCSRSCVRYFSYLFHYCVFGLSLAGAFVLLALNGILLTSVHVMGSNTIPPEVDRVCVTICPASRTIHSTILPAPFFSKRRLEDTINSKYLLVDMNATTVCKPLWEDGGLGLGLKRKPAGPWQHRTIWQGQVIAVATQVVLNNTVPDESYLELKHDHAVLYPIAGEHVFGCRRGSASDWIFEASIPDLPFPYFIGCRQNWRFAETSMIECHQQRRLSHVKAHRRFRLWAPNNGHFHRKRHL